MLPSLFGRRGVPGRALYVRLRRRAAYGSVAAIPVGLGWALTKIPNWRPVPLLIFVPIVTGAIALSPLVLRVVQRRFDLFEPITPASVMLFALFAIRPFYVIIMGQTSYRGIDFSHTRAEAAFAGLVGTAAFVIGYEYASRRRSARARCEASARVRPLHRTSDCDHGLVLGPWSLCRESHEGWVVGGGYIGSCGGAFAGCCQPKRKQRVPYGSAHSAGVRRDGRHSNAIYDVSTSWSVDSCRFDTYTDPHFPLLGRFTAVRDPLAAGSGRVLVPLARPQTTWAICHACRDSRVRVHRNGACMALGRCQGKRRWRNGDHQVGFAKPGATAMRFVRGSDTEMYDALAIQMAVQTRPGDFFYGRATIGDLLIQPIPSMVIAKPARASDLIRIKAFGHPCDPLHYGCPDLSAVGTFYQDFWWPGIVVGMLVFGGLCAVIWRRWRADPTDPGRIAMAAVGSVFSAIVLRAGVEPALAWSLYFALPAALALKVTSRREALTVSVMPA